MIIVSVCAFGAVLAILAHLVILPLAKRRPVLLRGAEAYALVALAIVAVAFISVWMLPVLLLLIAQFVVARVWRPWVVLGLATEQVLTAVVKASTMVRVKRTIVDDRTFVMGERSTLIVRTLAPRIQTVTVRVSASNDTGLKKIALFRNVLRKTVQNYSLGRS
ncbi:hypothetical protein ITJ38_13530 [Agreia pratensis]|uniref:Uncharacterized protein n=1 Tax=Agreia pratensis TaxID=150121 RepID=A0A1X7JRR8_9MICO|nr:hypothetical protein [Agreia pratensis]MBF4635431.1 hypothetical protein [Agreia pratensis]SMG30960.1 hypothetical protein SAMN06296010_1738 [Agreia pratensis]